MRACEVCSNFTLYYINLEVSLRDFSISRDIISSPGSVMSRLAVVCGGSRGIGKAVSLLLAQRGCRLAVVSRNEDAARTAVASLHGGKCRNEISPLQVFGWETSIASFVDAWKDLIYCCANRV